MFTTGSKLFIGATVLATIAAVVVGVTTGGAIGLTATIGLISAAAALALLAGINWMTRDGNVSAMEPGVQHTAPAAQPAAQRSIWPLATGFGGALLVVGAVSKPLVFKIGIVVILAAVVEWMVQAWSERASADAGYNAGLRKRMLHPLEFPLLAAGGLGIIIYSFSRIMLWIDKSAGPATFVIIGALVLLGGFILAVRPGIKGAVITSVCAVAALGLISTGAVAALSGQREIDEHPTSIEHPEICNAPGKVQGEEQTEIDDRASQNVANKASIAAVVVLEDGQLRAYSPILDVALPALTVGRSANTNLLFRNLDDDPRRFTVNMGKFTTEQNGISVVDTPQKCTSLVDPGKETFLTVKFPKLSAGSEEPYSIVVPGIDDQKISVVVP